MDHTKEAAKLRAALDGFLARKGQKLEKAAEDMARSLRNGGAVLVFGNGGSAAEAQHFAAELVNKFQRLRPAIRAVSLTTDTSILTSIANDASFDRVFSRQVEALGRPGDVALALSTSGTSPNIVQGLRAARAAKMLTVALTGKGGGDLAGLADHLLDVPSTKTPRVQEVHLFLLHALVLEVEKRLA